jgi:imidazolonepropionase-like amidohydrolase
VILFKRQTLFSLVLPVIIAGVMPVAAAQDHAFETDAERVPTLEVGTSVVLRNVMIHSAVRPAFRGTVVVADGKIQGVFSEGEPFESPANSQALDLDGMHLAPGVVDTHSHSAIERGVNEGSVSITAEVTMRDVVDADDIAIYRALAGGVTTIRLLHGSANAIGGRDAVLKLRWGVTADELLIEDAEQGIKFALGENPKRSNGSRGSSRFPATRMGIEALYQRAFERAREYDAEIKAYNAAQAAGADPVPVRRDIRLEVLAGILAQDVIVHSHCYRADEILMLIRTAQQFGFRIGTLQHVLEGYKVAHEMAEANVPGSAFADWWGYKVEAYDAIPQAPHLMAKAGVLTSINSDSDEMMRRLYEEAAKSVHYAGMDRVEALKLVTLNGALQLGLGDRIGSIEVGKDADLVLLNGDPLSGLSRVEWTMVEGELQFQRRDAFGLDENPGTVTPIEEGSYAVSSTLSGPLTVLAGGTIHTITGGVVEGGSLVMQGDRIVAVESAWDQIEGARVIDVSGMHVWPGMISLNSAVGLHEIGAVRATDDTSEIGGNQPDLRVTASIHAESAHIGVTRHNGITRVQTTPRGGGPVRGQSAVLQLDGYTWEEMLKVDRDMLHVNFPRIANIERDNYGVEVGNEHIHDNICGHSHGEYDCFTSGALAPAPVDGEGESRAADSEAVKALHELFEESLDYGRRRDEAMGAGQPAPVFDPRLDALVPFARGEKPVALHASNAQTILSAAEFAATRELDALIYGGREAWKVADTLAQTGLPVVIGSVWALPSSRYDPYDSAFANAAVLQRAGVRFAITTNDTENERNLPFQAAKAAAFGLPLEEAVRSVTWYPAQFLGIDDRVGSLKAGKVADVVVTSGHLLEIDSAPQYLFIAGREVDLGDDKQSRLYERYSKRLQEVRSR